ncbi:hypothetical protein GCM10022254_75540 [Actinomadura meridiana]|uniref:Uncharacterized protein n=1 Tax=Actinomadura meridiana TaxID=559626 RepID=A0ABP8CR82_9ACTN
MATGAAAPRTYVLSSWARANTIALAAAPLEVGVEGRGPAEDQTASDTEEGPHGRIAVAWLLLDDEARRS